MYNDRKHLVRCNAKIEKRVIIDGKETWEYDGFIEFETKLDITFIMSSDESILNDAFQILVEKHNTSDLRYDYIDFELEYHYPLKLKGNPIIEYNKRIKQAKDNIKKISYGK